MGAHRLFKRKAGEPVNFFVTHSPTQAVLQFCAGCLVAASIIMIAWFRLKVKSLRTANSASAEFPDLEFDAFSTPNALPDSLVDGWYVVAPFGEFPEPNGTYTQVFGPKQAESMIRTWNSIPGRAFRWMKNVRHRLNPSLTLPISPSFRPARR